MKNVLISGYIGFGNFGDEAIFSALSTHLKSIGMNVSVLCSNKNKVKKEYQVKTYYYKNIFQILKAVFSTDILISGGGSLLQNKTGNLSLIYYLFIIFLSKLFFKKVLIFAQGIESIEGGFFKFLTKIILKTCDFITVRDENSKEFLKKLNINSILVSDPAYSLVQDTEPQKNKEGLLIQLRNYKKIDDDFIKTLKECINETYKGKISVLALQDTDEKICLKFIEEFGYDIEFIKNQSIEKTIEAVNNAKYIISTRLHGLIIASALNTKPFALIYDNKIKTISDELHLQNIDLSDYNKHELIEKLTDFFNSPNETKSFRRFDWECIDSFLEGQS